ncbi:hypothetical protein BRARA_I00349 [Brassica rapa]|uniref:Mediator complex subunit 15 KIX domain-containing protein n=1 Tax=Brassica campestris TaxID=3711 RepID=A0A397XQL4_BRACM|nr:hypothetical protein BRARA_I00349 [Brassica rapa]
MEGTSSWKPNEQGGDSLANDWRSQHEPDLRKKVIVAIVERLKICFSRHITDTITKSACTFEEKIYGMAKDKGDYLRKIHEKILAFERKIRAGTSANGANTPHPAQALNQGQSLPTSLTYAQTPTNQPWLSQSNIQSKFNTPESSGLPIQSPMTVSAAQNLNVQMGERVESSLGPGPQRQIQGRQQQLQKPQQQQLRSNTMYQHHGNQQQQSLLPHHRSSSPIKLSFPQSSALSSHQQQMAVPSREHKQLERKYHISQLMNGQDTQQNHLTSPQNNGEKQRISQQNNTTSFNVHGSKLLGAQGQEVEKSQPLMLQHLNETQRFQAAGSLHQSQNLADQQNQPYQLQKPTFQDSTSKTFNPSGGDWREETYQKIKALKDKYIHILSELFQKLSYKLQENMMPSDPRVENLRATIARLGQVLVYLNVSRRSVSEQHRDKFSALESLALKFTKHQREKEEQQQVHIPPPQIHQTALQTQSGQVHASQTAAPHSSQTRPRIEPKDVNTVMSSSGNVVVHSPKQNPPSNQKEVVHSNISQAQSSMFQKKQFHHLPKQEQPSASSPHMQKNNSSPQLVEQQTLPTPTNKTAAQEHPLVTLSPEPISERPIDRLIKAIQSSSPESLAQSVSEMRSVISLTDMLAGSVHTIGGSRARLGEDLSERTRFRVQQGDTHPTKRFKRSFTAMPSQTDSYKRFSVNKIEPSYALLQEIIEINGRFVETVVNICNEDVCPSEATSGTVVVTCSYVPVALSATFKALYNSGHISQIQPLRLLVPENYPNSPIIIEKILFDGASDHKFEDLSARARSRFSSSMKEAMSLKEIAKVWDECARATMLEYAERHGGGTFSSKYGRWESVLRSS